MRKQKGRSDEVRTRQPCGLGRRLLAMTYDAVAVIALMTAAIARAVAAIIRAITATAS